MSDLIKIAVDAMGGDGSPKKIIDGIIYNTKNNNKHIKIDDLNYLKKKILDCLKPINECYFPIFPSKKVNQSLNNYYYLRSVSRFESIILYEFLFNLANFKKPF